MFNNSFNQKTYPDIEITNPNIEITNPNTEKTNPNTEKANLNPNTEKTCPDIENLTIINSGYTKEYVKELEHELQRLMKENIYLQSDEYINKILANRQMLDIQKQNQLMNRKINFLILLVRKISHNLVDREHILMTLKSILDGDFSKISRWRRTTPNRNTNSKKSDLTRHHTAVSDLTLTSFW